MAKEYSPEGYDAIYDANGVETLKESYEHLSCGAYITNDAALDTTNQ